MAENTQQIRQILGAYTQDQINQVLPIHFYKLGEGGVYFYLFGTNHSVSLEQFPKKALAGIEGILEQCSYFICEGFRPSMTQAILEKFGYLRDSNDTGPYWIDELSGREKEAVNSILGLIKERHQLTFENRNIQIGAIPLFIIDNIFGRGMDSEVQKKYRREDNFYSLDEDDGQFGAVQAQHLLPLYRLTQIRNAAAPSASDLDTLSGIMEKQLTFT